MGIIQLPGYTENEKVEIASLYLLPRQPEANGLNTAQCELSNDALHALIQDYTREAGVRGLEREISSVLRYAAVCIAEGSAEHLVLQEKDLTPPVSIYICR